MTTTSSAFAWALFDDNAVQSMRVRLEHRSLFLEKCLHHKDALVEDMFDYFETWCRENMTFFKCSEFPKRLRKRLFYMIVVLQCCYSVHRTKNDILKKCHQIMTRVLLEKRKLLQNLNVDTLTKSIPEIPEEVAQIVVDHIRFCSSQGLSCKTVSS